jgi:hypothetical protein
MSSAHDFYYRAVAADEAFSAELEQVFGKHACNARYDKRSTATPELQRLGAAKRAADLALHIAFRESRGEPPLSA